MAINDEVGICRYCKKQVEPYQGYQWLFMRKMLWAHKTCRDNTPLIGLEPSGHVSPSYQNSSRPYDFADTSETVNPLEGSK